MPSRLLNSPNRRRFLLAPPSIHSSRLIRGASAFFSRTIRGEGGHFGVFS